MPILRPATAGRFHPAHLFRPESVAVIGAGTALGGTVMRNMLRGGFKGAILPVQAGAAAVSGILAYPDSAALPVAPDLAVIATDADGVAPALHDLAARGTFAAVCLTPAPGLLAAGRAAGVRVAGPSAFGLIVPGLGLNASTAHLQPRLGRVALVSQSAALCRSVLDWAEPNGVGFSYVVGTGGNADIGFGLVLDWLSRDAETGAILLDIRGITDRRRFLSAARAAARLRPVVAIHAGGRLSDPTGRADAVFNAALRRAGVIRVERLADLLAAAETLTRAKPPRSDSVVVVHNAIGPAQLAADAALTLGLPLAALTPATLEVLRLNLPPGPPDAGLVWTGATNAIRLAETAAMLSAAPEVGGVVVVMSPNGPGDGAAIEALAACLPSMKVPLLACILGETTGAPHRRTLAAAGVPVFNTPEQTMRGFGQLVEQRRARAAARELPASTVLALAPDRAAVRRLFASARAAGRAGLLQDEALVARILDAVVKAVPGVPVTLKIRTGWDREHRNALNILQLAENAGVQALAMHGRTRACAYTGDAEYDTIRAVKAAARIPVIANGDITTPEKAQFVLDYTGADAVMIGRAAQGRPWIFREIEHFLNTGEHLPQPEVTEIHAVLLEHIHDLYAFYGDLTGVRIARKHISWYTRGLIGSSAFRHTMNQLDSVAEQLAMVNDYFALAARAGSRLRYETASDTPSEHRSASTHKNHTTQDLPPASLLAA